MDIVNVENIINITNENINDLFFFTDEKNC